MAVHATAIVPSRETAIATASISDLLAEWRAADRLWEEAEHGEAERAAAREVVAAWAAYQDAALPSDSREFMLVADHEGVYVGATSGVRDVLGFEPADLVGMRIADLAVAELRQQTPEDWARFLADGRQDGSFQLRHKDGGPVALRFQARAHHPVAGVHVSRLWPADPAREKSGVA